MNINLDKNQIERFSRQIVLKNIGPIGQKKIIKSKDFEKKFFKLSYGKKKHYLIKII